MATILLTEPHPLLRLGLRHLLVQSQLPIEVIDFDPRNVDMAVPPADAPHRNADLLIFGMTPENDWTVLHGLCKSLAPQRVLVLADTACPGSAESMNACDVRGFLSKACSAEVLDAAIRLVLAGGECFPSWLHAAGETAAMTAPTGLRVDGPHAAEIRFDSIDIETPALGAHMLHITERQYEVLTLLARGYPIKTISRLLNISVATAKTHACTLYQRLHVRNKGEAVYEALRRGAKLNWQGPAPVPPLAARPVVPELAAGIPRARTRALPAVSEAA